MAFIVVTTKGRISIPLSVKEGFQSCNQYFSGVEFLAVNRDFMQEVHSRLNNMSEKGSVKLFEMLLCGSIHAMIMTSVYTVEGGKTGDFILINTYMKSIIIKNKLLLTDNSF